MLRLLTVMMLCVSFGYSSNTITNYKSGISIGLTGTDGADYVFERWYGDSLIDDHGVIYIKSGTDIGFSHNARNINHSDVASVGTIRYKVDRDLSYKDVWSYRFLDTGRYDYNLIPVFTAPFSFDDLDYGPDHPSVPVVGTVGPVPGTVHNATISGYKEHWYRGLHDAAGDEWHIITVGDDDTELIDLGYISSSPTNIRMCGSDGKIHYFIVNPATPCVWLTADAGAEWYTTPAKAYFIPQIREQTSYVTDGVKINLANIMNTAPVHYRIDGGSYALYAGPISVDGLADGPHVLECYYTEGTVRTRAFVKNPGYPSDDDRFTDGTGHGYLVWEDDAYLEGIKERLVTGATNTVRGVLRERYDLLKRNKSEYGSGGEWFAAQQNKGERVSFISKVSPFANALITKIEGLDDALEYAQYAKDMTLENELSIDPVGYELDMNFSLVPSHRERLGLGYYNGKAALGIAHAYDLLIKDFRAPGYMGGYTAIEDHKVRDQLASFILLCLHDRQGMLYHPGMGISMGSRNIYAMVAAMAIPAYSSPCYGTSGFDGAATADTWLPFPDQAATWKQLFYENSVPQRQYPNQQFTMGILAEPMQFDLPYLHNGQKDAGTLDGNIKESGISNYPSSSIAYNNFHQVGGAVGVYSNTLRIRPGHGIDTGYLDRYFAACFDSLQPDDVTHNQLTGYYPNPLVLNERHADLAERAISRLFYEGTSLWTLNGAAGMAPYTFVWVNDDWENWISAIDEKTTAGMYRLPGIVDPVTDRFVIPAASRIDPASVRLYRVDGYPLTVPVSVDGGAIRADVSSLPAGIYHYTAGSGPAGTFVKQ